MQHKINLNGKTVLFVGVPSIAKINHLPIINSQDEIVFECDNEIIFFNKLPTGDWNFIGVYPELTEDMAKMVNPYDPWNSEHIGLWEEAQQRTFSKLAVLIKTK